MAVARASDEPQAADAVSRRIFISAGEVSGDMAGARLIREIRRRDASAYIFGTGGRCMATAGADICHDTNQIGVVGITEIVTTLPSVVAASREIRRRVRAVNPDVAVLIGNDVFNVLLGRWLRRRGIRTVSYFPPQVWVWRSLAPFIARSFDAIVTSFPDEQAVYQRASTRSGATVSFVGHYLAEELRHTTADDRAHARAILRASANDKVIGLLPGSRQSEIRRLTPVLLAAAEAMLERDPTLVFAVAAANARCAAELRELTASRRIGGHVRIRTDSGVVMRSADLVLVASGTASLEAALLGVPMVIAYKVSAVTHLVVRTAIRLGLIDSYTVGLPNLIVGECVVPEALQRRATAQAVADEAWRLLFDSPRRSEMSVALAGVRDKIRGEEPVTSAAATVLAWADRGRRPAATGAARETLVVAAADVPERE